LRNARARRWALFLAAFAAAVALFGAAAQEAQAAACRAPRNADSYDVQVDIAIGEPAIRNDISKAELGTTNIHGRRGQVLGNTQSGLDLRWSTSAQVVSWHKAYCFWVTKVAVQLSYHQLDVNVASEYAPGTCQYQAILDHEFQHVQVAHSVLEPYAQRIRQALTSLAIPTSNLPAVADSPAIARQEMEKVIRRALMPVRDQMNRLMDERQAQVDTLDNYRRTWRRCRDW